MSSTNWVQGDASSLCCTQVCDYNYSRVWDVLAWVSARVRVYWNWFGIFEGFFFFIQKHKIVWSEVLKRKGPFQQISHFSLNQKKLHVLFQHFLNETVCFSVWNMNQSTIKANVSDQNWVSISEIRKFSWFIVLVVLFHEPFLIILFLRDLIN